MRKYIDVPVFSGNDANAAALGEVWKGGGKGCRNVVAVTLGTGVGGGIIVNGKILSGSGGAGGEIGHIHMVDDETLPTEFPNELVYYRELGDGWAISVGY